MTWAVIRVRGEVNVKPKIRETMRLLRLNRGNHCEKIPEDATILDSRFEIDIFRQAMDIGLGNSWNIKAKVHHSVL